MNEIIVALITGGLALLGVMVSNRKSAREIEHKLETQQAVTDTKLEELTREVREHNNFARRMPVLEDHMKTVDKKLDKLESYHSQA